MRDPLISGCSFSTIFLLLLLLLTFHPSPTTSFISPFTTPFPPLSVGDARIQQEINSLGEQLRTHFTQDFAAQQNLPIRDGLLSGGGGGETLRKRQQNIVFHIAALKAEILRLEWDYKRLLQETANRPQLRNHLLNVTGVYVRELERLKSILGAEGDAVVAGNKLAGMIHPKGLDGAHRRRRNSQGRKGRKGKRHGNSSSSSSSSSDDSSSDEVSGATKTGRELAKQKKARQRKQTRQMARRNLRSGKVRALYLQQSHWLPALYHHHHQRHLHEQHVKYARRQRDYHQQMGAQGLYGRGLGLENPQEFVRNWYERQLGMRV